MEKTLDQLDLCRLIADVAHAAKGQTRADGETPYIAHPARVVEILLEWYNRRENPAPPLDFSLIDIIHALASAWLHDVVEDTDVTLSMLEAWGIDERTVHLVNLLTKKNAQSEAETPEYYAEIAKDDTALLVKAADRCSNLEDAIEEVKRGYVRRWKNYVMRTYIDVLPLYTRFPVLLTEIAKRLLAIEQAILEQQMGGPVGIFDCGEIIKK
jgi:(p)ppGpp synthase/HD superfamily hydrolase